MPIVRAPARHDTRPRSLQHGPAWSYNVGVSGVEDPTGDADAQEIWCVREPGKFREIRDDLARRRPELSDFCDDYTPAFTQFAVNECKKAVVLDRQTYEEVDGSLRQLALSEYVAPSSGILALHYVLKRFPGSRVVLAGFTHAGWQWHPFGAERDLVNCYIRSGRVQRM